MTTIFRSARMLSLLTLISRGLGLVRDMICGWAFGLQGVWSAFSIGFQIPNLFRRLFGEGALSAASIPVMSETLTHQGKDAVGALAGRMVGLLLATLTGIWLIGEGIVLLLYLRFGSDSSHGLALALTAVLLPYLVLICTVAALGGIQNVFNRFASPALMPILLNLFMIAGAVSARFIWPENDRAAIFLLAVAVLAGGVVQLALQWIAVRRCGIHLRLSLNTQDPAIRRIAWTMIPMIAGMGAVQLNTLLDAMLAWWFVQEQITPGQPAERVGPAILYYAQRLYQFPLGVFAIALATAIFPTLSRHAAERNMSALSETLGKGLRVATFQALPCLVGLILVRKPLVETLFGRGEFAAWDQGTARVGFAVSMYALGIWAYFINHLLIRAFYSLKDARSPMRVAGGMVGLNLILNLILVNTALKEGGLALATSICSVMQVAILIWIFRRRFTDFPMAEPLYAALKALVATTVMGVAVYGMDRAALADERAVIRLIGMVLVGAGAFLSTAWLMKSSELRELMKR